MTVRFLMFFLAGIAGLSQAETYFVSPRGNDAHAGSRDGPLKTISAAATKAMAGDTVLVLEGVYRERVTPPRGGNEGKPIIYRGEPGKRVVIKGSNVWRPNWKPEGDRIYSAHPDDAMFDDRSSEYVDHYNPLKVELASTPWHREGKREHERGFGGDAKLAYTCGQVFVDGKPFREVPFRHELKPDAWFYDTANELVLIHFGDRDPTKCEVELTTRRRIFAPQTRGLGHIVVEGFIFEHCGNQYPTNFWDVDANAQRGAVGTEAGHDWIIRHNVIRYAKTFALDVGRVNIHADQQSAYDNLVEENYIIDNGSAGIMSCGSRNLVIRNNVVLRNNRLHFLGKKRWEQAGIKCHWFRNGLIEGNYISHNYDTYGIWLDNQFPDSRISGNVIHDNGRAGIFLEMSDYDFDRLLVDGNYIFDNHENAVYIHDASGATFVHNLLANTRDKEGYGQAVYIRQVGPRTRTGNHTFVGNLLIGNARNVDVDYPAFRGGVQHFDYNLYDVSPEAQTFVINSDSDSPAPWSSDEFRALISNDLGSKRAFSANLKHSGKAAMAFAAWKSFWQQHDESNDRHSRCSEGNSVSFDPATYELTIELDADPPEFPAGRVADTNLLPSKFQNGKNKRRIWEGLPVLGLMNCRPPTGLGDLGKQFYNSMTAITVVIAVILALNVPDNFDPDANMLTNESGLHSVRDTIRHAARLVAQGEPEDLELAGKMIDAVLQCQERRPDDANYGNFLWYKENEVVEDLNGVSFTLNTMIPMMIRHGDRLPPELRQRVLESIRLGLNATARLDVSPGYTNIAVFDVVNTCLGGELLHDPVFIARGRLKLALWMLFTAQFGIPFEYNSPTYTGVTIDALNSLATYSNDRDTRVRARTALSRIGLSVALHIHPSTGCWAGPHSRAYHGGLASRGDKRVNQWVKDGVLPPWTIDAMRLRPEKMQVVETAYPDFNLGISTYHSPSFALGVAANEGLGGQGNSLIAQFRRPGNEHPGVLYSRYLVNDKWMGTFVHPTDRKVTRDLMQEGKFFGVQQGERAIGIYTPAALEYTTSAKATLIWTDRKSIDEILINHERIDQLPAEISPGDTVVIASGDAMTAVRPLTRTDLGRQSPMQLTQIGDDLVLEMYNYRGPKKVFWELQWPGGFFQGVPQSGFYIEMAERPDYRSVSEFSEVVAGGKFTDVTAAPFTYSGTGERLWTVEYSRDGKTLGIEADLMKWKLKRRLEWTGEIGWPMLESPVAGENRTGQVAIGDARLQCGKEAGWLFASPETKRWAVGYVGLIPAPLTLTVPAGQVKIDAIQVGTVVWDDGRVTIDAVGIKGVPQVIGGQLIEDSLR